VNSYRLPILHFQPLLRLASVVYLGLAGLAYPGLLRAFQTTAPAARALGTIESISGRSFTVISDAGSHSEIATEVTTKFLQIEPGKTDLKEASSISFSDLQPGDRVLARGSLAEDGTIRAASVVAIKKTAIAEKQAKERAEWQRGVGGLVRAIDSSAGTIAVTTNGLSSSKEVVVHFTPDTILRRYASDSTRFDSAKSAAISEIHPGDQLRARGTRSESGADFTAAEIVSGTFRSIAGTVSSSDASANTLVVQDLATKSAVSLIITAESQMRKLPPQFADGLAARLKSQTAGAEPGATAGASAPLAAPARASQAQQGTATLGAPGGRGGDFQQMIARMPAASLADLQKGDAVMVVTTQGNGKDPLTVITLLDGVEAILRASPKGSQDMILSPWSLGGGEPSGN
jgi:hypothetical protein